MGGGVVLFKSPGKARLNRPPPLCGSFASTMLIAVRVRETQLTVTRPDGNTTSSVSVPCATMSTLSYSK